MKEIVVISGKGGTGKTSITASLGFLAKENAIVADCDVDAADLHLLYAPDFDNQEEFFSGFFAEIDSSKCINCGKCMEVCHFDAVSKDEKTHKIDSIKCEGCSYCFYVCPTSAIEMKDAKAGKTFVSNTRVGMPMVHAALDIGADNSGKLVAEVKNKAKKLAEKLEKEIVIVDGSPGVGCPVVSSLSGANFVVIVTEPTVSGLHDMKRVHDLIKRFKIKSGCIINKYDLNLDVSNEIEEYLNQEDIVLLAKLPYDKIFTQSMIEQKTVVESGNSKIADEIKSAWNKIKQILF